MNSFSEDPKELSVNREEMVEMLQSHNGQESEEDEVFNALRDR